MKKNLLIVDDVKTNRIILRKILENEYNIYEAENGQVALDIMNEKTADLSALLLDLSMPVMDGFEVLRIMRSNQDLSQIPVLVATGKTEADSEVKALELGAIDYFTKPYNPTIIRQRLRNTINLRETASEVNALQRDRLTGLFSRESFFERAEAMIKSHKAGYYILSSFDINNFKIINDQYGTEKGDYILRYIAERFQAAFEPGGGLCCRIMADNFAVLYPQKFIKSEEIQKTQHEIIIDDGSVVSISFSVGRYIIDDLTLSVSAMYDRAVLAETSIKGRADIHIAVYDESMRRQLLREQIIVNEMAAALAENQFEIWLQPQFSISTGSLTGSEALVRWRHPQKGLIPPGDFIPVFEKNGFIYNLDKYVWRQACATLKKWFDRGDELIPISVNVSRYDLLHEDLIDVIMGLLEEYELSPSMLRLEITESAFADTSSRISEIVQELVTKGFTIEIDDFGSGYSSLNTLKEVPASVLKLDMRFLESGGNSERGGKILESVVRMAKWLGMPVIAEGVETIAQASFLKSIGCYYVQGYLYGKPMPVTEFEHLLKHVDGFEKMMSIEFVEKFDDNAFWTLESMDTLIFNKFVGGACIFEYLEGEIEIIRFNDKYILEIGGGNMTAGEVENLDFSKYMNKENLDILIGNIEKAIAKKSESTCETYFWGLGGRQERVYINSTVKLLAKTGNRYMLYAAVSNTTSLHESEQKMRSLYEQLYNEQLLQEKQFRENEKILLKYAQLDGMTGLYNKTTSEALIQKRLQRCDGTPCTLILIDIDNLKAINDKYGYASGDAAIELIADTLKIQFRQTDIVGRIGGDKYIVFLDGSENETKIRSTLTAFLRKLALSRIDAGIELLIAGSIGIAIGENGSDEYSEMYRKAEVALLQVKRNGKNGFAFYTEEMELDTYILEDYIDTSWKAKSFDVEELDYLLHAISAVYPLVISTNVTQNSYYMMRYCDFITSKFFDAGFYSQLVEDGIKSFHPTDRESFINTFSRSSILKAYYSGQRLIGHEGRQLGDDGLYRHVHTDGILFKAKKTDDILQIIFSREFAFVQTEHGTAEGFLTMSAREVTVLLQELKLVFDIVRMVEVEKMQPFTLNSSGRLIMNVNKCYAVWNKDERCKNCSSRDAFERRSRTTKFETLGDETFYIVSKYLEVDGKGYVLEVVTNVTEQVKRDSMLKQMNSCINTLASK